MVLVQLNKLIYDFLAKGNKPEHTVIKMGIGFHREFIKVCGSQISAEVGNISKYMDIPIEVTHYLESNQALIMNEKEMIRNWAKDFKLDYEEQKGYNGQLKAT